MINSKWLRWSVTVAASALLVGCAAPGKQSARRTVAEKLVVSLPPSPEDRRTSSGGTGSPETLSVRLARAEVTASQPAEVGDAERRAGKTFLPPPATPPTPQAIEVNRALDPPGEPLTLELLESLACRNNPTLLQARGQIEGELGKAIQAGLWPNPTLAYVQEQIGVAGTPGEFVGGTVRQRIVTGRKLDLSRAKFLARTQAAEWHALEQQYRVLNDVRIHYFRARGNYELVRIHGELLKKAEDNVLTAREQYNVGQATRAGVHLANVALQRARLDLLRAENNFRQSFEALTAVVGVDLPRAPLTTPLEGDMNPIDHQVALDRLMAQAPQLQATRSKLDSDRITIRRETVEPLPDIVVEAGVGRNFEAEETVGAATVAIEVPLYDRNQGTIRQAEADYVRQQGEVRRLELMLKQQLARVYRDYLTALQFATNYAEVILPEARSAYELQLRSYQDNRIPWAEVLRTQEEYFLLRAEYIRNLIQWRESEVLVAGFLLHGGLTAPTGPSPPGHINAVPKPR